MFNKVYLGSEFVKKIYLGSTLIKYNIQPEKPQGHQKGIWILTKDEKLRKYDKNGKLLVEINEKVNHVCFDEQGNVYCADTYLYAVRKYNSEGKMLLEISNTSLFINDIAYKNGKIYLAGYNAQALNAETLQVEYNMRVNQTIYTIIPREHDTLLFRSTDEVYRHTGSVSIKATVFGLQGEKSIAYHKGYIYAGKDYRGRKTAIKLDNSLVEEGDDMDTSSFYFKSYGNNLYMQKDDGFLQFTGEFPYEWSFMIQPAGNGLAENTEDNEIYIAENNGTLQVYDSISGEFKKTIKATISQYSVKDIYFA